MLEISLKDQEKFRKEGFLLLKNFYPKDFISYIKDKIDHQIDAPTDKYQSGFNRLAFDLFENDPVVIDFIQSDRFKGFMSMLTQRKMIFAQSLAFELKKKVDKGFPYHIGTQSFGYHRAEDFGCTIWAPLIPVSAPHYGGMKYIPRDKVSGSFMYTQVDPAVFEIVEKSTDDENSRLILEDYMKMRDEPLNSDGMKMILDHFAVQDDFEVGDALIFDKNVIHKSVMLEDGDYDSRTAFVMRFFCSESKYDFQRAMNLEVPRKKWEYAGPTSYHLDVAKENGQSIKDSEFFKEKSYCFL